MFFLGSVKGFPVVSDGRQRQQTRTPVSLAVDLAAHIILGLPCPPRRPDVLPER